jgi:cytoskeleton protein RodZ
MDEQTQPESTSRDTISTGEILKNARQKLGIELAELADQIRVPLAVLEAIEIDRVPKNLPETFVRGYIRAYARKVDVDEALVLPKLETLGVDPSARDMQSFSRRNKRKALEKRLVLGTWLVVAVIVVASIVWWWQDAQQTDIAPVATTEMSVEVPASIVAAEPQIESDDASAMPEQTMTVVAQPQQSATPAPVSLTKEQRALIADNGEPDEDGFIKVEMRFDNDCWVEVYDVNDERIAIGTKPAGYVMTLNAQGPLNVVLGNTQGVSIWVNNKRFDTSDLPKNRVARFELEAL